MKITGDTITDMQIRELLDLSIRSGDIETIADCQVALYDLHTIEARESAKAKARARCAELFNAKILNARNTMKGDK